MPGQPRRLTRGILDIVHVDENGSFVRSRADFVAACEAVWDVLCTQDACKVAAQMMLKHMEDVPIQVCHQRIRLNLHTAGPFIVHCVGAMIPPQ
jgi:hypothetical protein